MLPLQSYQRIRGVRASCPLLNQFSCPLAETGLDMTPEAWIMAQLPKPQAKDKPLSDKIDDLIGTIESSPWQVMFDALQEFPEDLHIERDRS